MAVIEKIKKLFSVKKLLEKNKVLGELPSEKEVYSRAFKISWPCTLETVLVGLVGSVDIMMVGTLGSSAIAAVGLTNQPKYLLLALIRSLNVGVTAISANCSKFGNSCFCCTPDMYEYDRYIFLLRRRAWDSSSFSCGAKFGSKKT